MSSSSLTLAKRHGGVCEGSLIKAIEATSSDVKSSSSSAAKIPEYCVLVGVRLTCYESWMCMDKGEHPTGIFSIVGASAVSNANDASFRVVTNQGTHLWFCPPSTNCRDLWLKALNAGLERHFVNNGSNAVPKTLKPVRPRVRAVNMRNPPVFCHSCGKLQSPKFPLDHDCSPLSQYGMEFRMHLCPKCNVAQGLLEHMRWMQELYAASHQEQQSLYKARAAVLTKLQPSSETPLSNTEPTTHLELTPLSHHVLSDVLKSPECVGCARVSPTLERLTAQFLQGMVSCMEFIELLERAIGIKDPVLVKLKQQAFRVNGDMGTALRLLAKNALPNPLNCASDDDFDDNSVNQNSTELLQCILEFLLDLLDEGELQSIAFFWPQLLNIHLQMLPPTDADSLKRIELMEDFLLTVATQYSIQLAIDLIWSHTADLEDSKTLPYCTKRKSAVLRFLCELESLLFDFETGWGGGSVTVGEYLGPSSHQIALMKSGMRAIQAYRLAQPEKLSRSQRHKKLARERDQRLASNDSEEVNSESQKQAKQRLLSNASAEVLAEEALRVAKNADYLSTHLAFTRRLGDVAERLFDVPVNERGSVLETELAKLNASGTMGGDPLNYVKVENYHTRVARIPTTEGHVFRSKERTPVLLLVETMDEADEIAANSEDPKVDEEHTTLASRGDEEEKKSFDVEEIDEQGQERATSGPGKQLDGSSEVTVSSEELEDKETFHLKANLQTEKEASKGSETKETASNEVAKDTSQTSGVLTNGQDEKDNIEASKDAGEVPTDGQDEKANIETMQDSAEVPTDCQDEKGNIETATNASGLPGKSGDGDQKVEETGMMHPQSPEDVAVEGEPQSSNSNGIMSSPNRERKGVDAGELYGSQDGLHVDATGNRHALRRFDSPKGVERVRTLSASRETVEALVTNVVAKQLQLPELKSSTDATFDDKEKEDGLKDQENENGKPSDLETNVQPVRMTVFGSSRDSTLSKTGDTRREVLNALMMKGMSGSHSLAAGAASAMQRHLQDLERRRAVELLLTGDENGGHKNDREELLTLGIRSISDTISETGGGSCEEDDEVFDAIRLLLIQYQVGQGELSMNDAAKALAPHHRRKGRHSEGTIMYNGREFPEIDAGDVDPRLVGCGTVPPAVLQALTLRKANMISNGELLELVKKDLEFVRNSVQVQENRDKLNEDSQFWVRFAFGERWAEKRSRIAASSPDATKLGWDLIGVIVKANDDLRQEAFVMQLIELCKEAFEEAGLELWMLPYRILSTGRSTGIIEMVRNAMSFDALKKRPGYGKGGLRGHLQRMTQFAVDPGEAFKSAQRNFVRSLAAYSLLSYLFLFKDRHNGNILLDTAGHVIHIDFGFVFGIAPGGSFSLEISTPFKLTEEMIEVMDGLRSSLFSEFITLFCCGFLALQAHCDTFCTMVDITCKGSTFKCFEGRDSVEVVGKLRERFRPELNQEESIAFCLDLIKNATQSYGTTQYDYFQYLSQGIAT